MGSGRIRMELCYPLAKRRLDSHLGEAVWDRYGSDPKQLASKVVATADVGTAIEPAYLGARVIIRPVLGGGFDDRPTEINVAFDRLQSKGQ